MGALARFAERHFGVKTRATTADILTVASPALIQAAPNNPDRLMLILMNLSGTDMYVSPDTRTSNTHGVLLQNGGGALSLRAEVDGELVGYEWTVWCTVAAEELFVMEVEAD